MPRSRRGAQQPDTTLSQHMVDGVVIPGVRLVPSRKLAATKGGTSKKNDEDVKGGFWAETQTFKRDIAHLKSVFPGESTALLKTLLKEAIPPEEWAPSYPDLSLVESKLELLRDRRLQRQERRRRVAARSDDSGAESGAASRCYSSSGCESAASSDDVSCDGEEDTYGHKVEVGRACGHKPVSRAKPADYEEHEEEAEPLPVDPDMTVLVYTSKDNKGWQQMYRSLESRDKLIKQPADESEPASSSSGGSGGKAGFYRTPAAASSAGRAVARRLTHDSTSDESYVESDNEEDDSEDADEDSDEDNSDERRRSARPVARSSQPLQRRSLQATAGHGSSTRESRRLRPQLAGRKRGRSGSEADEDVENYFGSDEDADEGGDEDEEEGCSGGSRRPAAAARSSRSASSQAEAIATRTSTSRPSLCVKGVGVVLEASTSRARASRSQPLSSGSGSGESSSRFPKRRRLSEEVDARGKSGGLLSEDDSVRKTPRRRAQAVSPPGSGDSRSTISARQTRGSRHSNLYSLY